MHDHQDASLPHRLENDALPAWRRITAGEPRWAAAVAVVAVIALQLALPERLNLSSRWLLPAIEAALFVTLVISNPLRFERRSRPIRAASLTLIAVASLANAYSAVRLVVDIVSSSHHAKAPELLATGAAIYLTNIIVFGLWYWDLDRGGPAARAAGIREHPDFLFPQMTAPDMSPPDWEPRFADYLYVSFTNATAFSPTDTMPMTRWAKLAMMAQSVIALATVSMVLARAINILS
ncbi:DUF1345 domain-containing protein [Williamsia deligens]|uniref:DUF1345 domain-containing protein n=1 Tax=Williamsia deligens TaxID=321325 RepID=A0ABW3G475_9NOCA|nr:DUF1345 domain-containing protein [Williamsia deligens]MCP2194226.1 Protein of unknown function (DUF1345) [Williamsia deligens]